MNMYEHHLLVVDLAETGSEAEYISSLVILFWRRNPTVIAITKTKTAMGTPLIHWAVITREQKIHKELEFYIIMPFLCGAPSRCLCLMYNFSNTPFMQ